MHQICLVGGFNLGDNTCYLDDEKHFNQNTVENFTEEIDEADFVTQYNSSHDANLFLCWAFMNLLLSFVPNSSSLVTINTTLGRDVELPQSSEGQPVWVSIRDFLSLPDMLSLRTAGPN